jgi:hypothetical protein
LTITRKPRFAWVKGELTDTGDVWFEAEYQPQRRWVLSECPLEAAATVLEQAARIEKRKENDAK